MYQTAFAVFQPIMLHAHAAHIATDFIGLAHQIYVDEETKYSYRAHKQLCPLKRPVPLGGFHEPNYCFHGQRLPSKPEASFTEIF